MAKFNIEVDLDWISEDGDLDIELRDIITEKIVGKITSEAMKDVNEKVNARITSTIDAAISDKMNEVLSDFMTTPRTITDKYGDVKRRNISVIDLLKERCDAFIDDTVDESSGKVGSSGYGSKTIPRINYIIKQQIDSKMQYSIDRALDSVKKAMQEYIDTKMKSQIGEQMFKLLNLDKAGIIKD